MLYMDDSVLSQQDTMTWLESHQGESYANSYTTALPEVCPFSFLVTSI